MSTVLRALTNAKAAAIFYRLAVVDFLLFVIVAVASSILTALAGTQWSTSDNQTRLMIVVGIIGSVATTMKAFFSDAMSKVAKGQIPFIEAPPAPGTIVKETTASSATTTTPPATQ